MSDSTRPDSGAPLSSTGSDGVRGPAGVPPIRRMRWFDVVPAAALDAAIFGADAWSEEFFWASLATPGSSFVVLPAAELPAEPAAEPAGPAADPAGAAAPPGPGEPGSLWGYAGVSISGPQADVLTIAAHPQVRGRGVGTRLLRHLLDQATAAGCEVIHLDVRDDNVPALGLYAAHGFEEIGRRRGYYTGADAIVMRAFLR